MAPIFSKLKNPFGLLLLLSVILLADICQSKGSSKVRCGEAIDDFLFSICENGFNNMNLGGPLRRLRSRRQAGIFLSPHILPNQFEQPGAIIPTRGKRKLSLKQMLKRETRWRRKHQVTGKRLRRESSVTWGVADECCKSGCSYSEIGAYCRALAESKYSV